MGVSRGRERGVVLGIVVRQALASLADNFSAPYVGYYLASITSSGVLQGLLQFSTNSLPTAAQVLLGPLMDWWGRYITVLLTTSVAASLLWIAISLTIVPEVFVGLVTFRAIVVGLSGLAFTAFLGTVFSAATRGRVLSLVNLVSQGVALSVFVFTAVFLTPDVSFLKYLFLFSGLVSLAASTIWIRLLHLDRNTSTKRNPGEKPPNPLKKVAQVASDKSFMKLNTAYAGYVAVMAAAWPWFPVAQRYVFRLSVSDLAVMNIASTLSTMVSQYLLMKYLSKLSLKWLIVASRAGFVIPPLFYAIAPGPELVYLSSILTGPFVAIGNVVVPLYVLNKSRKGMYASYVSLLNFSQGMAAALGSIVGGVAMDYLVEFTGGYEGLRVGFGFVALARAVMTVPFLKIDDSRL
ncbi:MAG: MFS transporter [Sulfolobales archaeon]